MSFVQLFYISKAGPTIDQNEIDSILAKARSFNSSQNIGGILLYRAGIFLQLLEGEPAPVNALYEKISKDKRHSNVIKMFEVEGNPRIFNDWSMGFCELGDLQVKMINEVLSWNKLISNSEKIDNQLILKMLTRFKEK